MPLPDTFENKKCYGKLDFHVNHEQQLSSTQMNVSCLIMPPLLLKGNI